MSIISYLFSRSRRNQFGSARWGKPGRDLMKSGLARGEGSFYIGESNRKPVMLPRMESLRHGLILGGSGFGKSTGYFLPNSQMAAGNSLVCTDPKSELWNLTAGFHKTPVRYAPCDPDASNCFNWIPLCRDPRLSELCARAIVESGQTGSTEQAWIDTETAFLSGLFAHASTTPEPTPLTAYRLFTRQTIQHLIDEMRSSRSDAARAQAMILSQTQEKMLGSIVPVVAAKLQFLSDPLVARFTSADLSPPAFSGLRERPTAIFWCLQESDMVRLKPLTSLFFSVVLEQLSAKTSNVVPVTLLLDEFANIGVIPSFDSTIALSRGRNISIWIGLQSLGQLEARYGKANAQTIISNCGTKIALSGLDLESAEYISRSLGDKTESVGKWSVSGVLNPTYSHSNVENARRLLTSDEVRRIPSDKAIVVSGNRRAMLLTKTYLPQQW